MSDYNSLKTRLDAIDKKLSQPQAEPAQALGVNRRGVPTGAPTIRRGESILSSRPFYFSNVIGMAVGALAPDRAKLEREQLEWFSKAMRQAHNYENENTILYPVAWDMVPQDILHSDEGQVMRAMQTSGHKTYDRMQAAWELRRASDQSAYAYDLGGSFVPPPEFGEPIELLRNEEVFLKAGATRIALPPQGSMLFPRLTAPTTGAAQPEGTQATYSNVTTGDVSLTAKAYSVFLRMSNQLAKFAPALASALLQADMMKTLGLVIDLDALEGAAGATNRIKGIINYANVNKVTPAVTAANGDTLSPVDLKKVLAKVFASNAKFNSWVMRYELFLNNITEFRADAVAASDNRGPYLYDIIRGPGDLPQWNLLGFPIAPSNQVGRNRVKGASGATLTYLLGGDFSDYLFGFHGALELAINMFGDTAWKTNQQEMRAIGYADGAPRHEASFCWIDTLTYVS